MSDYFFKKLAIMRLFILILMLMLSSHFASAINSYRTGDTLFVWAGAGLKMRETASFTGKVITSLAYGSVVTTLNYRDYHSSGQPFEVVETKPTTGCKGLVLTGLWVKIKVGQNEGFVFDAYLSHLPPFIIAPFRQHEDYSSEEHRETRTEWARRIWGVANRTGRHENDLADDNSKLLVYKNGASFQNVGGESTYGEIFIIPGISFEEGYLIFNFHEVQKSLGQAAQIEFRCSEKSTSPAGVRFEFSTQDENGCDYHATFSWSAGVFIFEASGGC